MGLAVVPYFAQNASTSSSEGGFWILMAFFPSSRQSFLALFLQVFSSRKTFALLVCRLSLCDLAWSCFLRESFVLAMSSWFFNAKFLPDFVSFGISYIRFLLQFCDDGDVCSELCYFQFNFFPPCFLGLETYALLGARSTMSMMAHAVAYSRLLIQVMLRSCPCLMLFRAKFARFSRISPTLLLIFTFGTGFLFFMAISLIISLFFLIRFTTSAIFSSSGVCWAAPFSYQFRLSVYFRRFGGGCIGSCGGSSWA